MTGDPEEERPVFASTVDRILARYQTGEIQPFQARKSLAAITLALAPDHIFDERSEQTLNSYLQMVLDLFHAGDLDRHQITTDILFVITAAALGDRETLNWIGLEKD